MTRNRDLGPILAIAGAAIAVVAVVAGFMVIGGPGQVRDERLDEITANRIWRLVNVVNCAFNATGTAPASVEAAHATRVPSFYPTNGPPLCGDYDTSDKFEVAEETGPIKQGDVSYVALNARSVKVCGNFRAESSDRDHMYPAAGFRFYPILVQPHPSGTHCYELELINTASPPLTLPMSDPFSVAP